MSDRPSVVITGGGTGGHVSPALAVGDALVASGCERSDILFVGGRRGIEGRLVPEAGYRLVRLPGRGIQRKVTRENVSAVLGLAASAVAAIFLALRDRPRVVVTVGGYAGFAYALAAVVLRIPLVVVTVDAVPGAVNRLVGRFASVNAVAFEGARLPREELTGPPVRGAALEVSRDEAFRREVRQRLGVDPARRLVVVTGGSLGAGSINAAALGLAERWIEREDVAVYHVAGERNLSEITGLATQRGLLGENDRRRLEFRLAGFDPDLVAAVAASDLVVCRAGASTVAELTAIGAPAVLVPLPGSPGDHQTKNAATLERAGAARVIADADLSSESLEVTLQPLLHDEAALLDMAAAARALGRRDAAQRVASIARRLAGGRGPSDGSGNDPGAMGSAA